MRTIGATILATAIFASSAFAATDAPLAPGKPAGVHNARLVAPGWVWVVGVGFVTAAAFAAMHGSGKPTVTTTSTTTNP